MLYGRGARPLRLREGGREASSPAAPRDARPAASARASPSVQLPPQLGGAAPLSRMVLPAGLGPGSRPPLPPPSEELPVPSILGGLPVEEERTSAQTRF